MSTPILVTGSAGNIGRPLVPDLLASGSAVRAAVTRTDSAPAELAGSELVAFDFQRPTTWGPAFDGVRTMFLLRPPQLSRVTRDLLPAVEFGARNGLRHVVFLSLQGADSNRVVPHARVEKALRASTLDWTFVRPSFFMQNLSTTHRQDVVDAHLLVPAGSGRTAFVDAFDVAAVAAAALRDPAAHVGRAWTPTGPEALTYDEVAAELSRALDRRIAYDRPGLVRYARHAHARLGLPWGMVAVTGAIYTIARLGLAAGLTDDVRTVTGAAPRPFADFARRESAAWAASAD